MIIKVNKQLLLESFQYPSRYELGEQVIIDISGIKTTGYIRTITFTEGKIRYSVLIKVDPENTDGWTTLHNLDSVLLSDGDGSKIDLPFDNYS